MFVVEQNRDAQMRTLLINELDFDPATAGSGDVLRRFVHIRGLSSLSPLPDYYRENKLARLTEVQS